jgi:hypothetical protein
MDTWLTIAWASTVAAGFFSGVGVGRGHVPAPDPEPVLQEPVARASRWLIVARPKQRYEFNVDNETDALREFFKQKGDPAKIIESRPLS